MKIFFSFINISVVLNLVIFLAYPAYAREISCQSAIFSDSTKQKRLYGKGVSNKIKPASTTKVMTALLVMENLSLNEYVTVSSKAASAQPTKLNLQPGEQYKISDLLKATLVNSANDASVALAEAVAGSEWQFVQMMNRRAKQAGAKHTKFANASGLPSKKVSQYSTAYDMYMIFRAALQYPFFRETIKAKYGAIYSKGGREISFKSHNKILFMGWNTPIYGKTGYTHAAGPCFIGTVQKGKSTLIMAVFNCKNRWTDIKYLMSRYSGLSP